VYLEQVQLGFPDSRHSPLFACLGRLSAGCSLQWASITRRLRELGPSTLGVGFIAPIVVLGLLIQGRELCSGGAVFGVEDAEH
jgi:hypothetical protein